MASKDAARGYGTGRSRREFAIPGSVPAFPAIRGGKLLAMGWHPKKPQAPWQVTKYVDVTRCPCTGAIPRQALPHWGTYWPAIYHKQYVFMGFKSGCLLDIYQKRHIPMYCLETML